MLHKVTMSLESLAIENDQIFFRVMSFLLRTNLIEDVLSFLVKYYCSGLVILARNCESLCTCIGYRLILVSYQSLSALALAKKFMLCYSLGLKSTMLLMSSKSTSLAIFLASSDSES